MTMSNSVGASGGGGSPGVDKRRDHHHHEGPRSRGGGPPAGGGGGQDQNQGSKYDDPPNSRLFIVCGKQITEEQFRDAFGAFGAIEEVWVLKDRVTGEPKGVTYIKFSKTSEAALAMEEMNGRCISGSPRPLKVLIAHSRDQGSRRDMNEEERLVRLFVVVPRTMTENDIRDHFTQFGDIDYVSVVKDRNTKESKGFAYVKYHRVSHAAKAFEDCDRTFKPVFADPKPQKSSYHDAGGTGGGGGERGGSAGASHGGPGSTASASSTSASMSTSFDMLSYMDTSQSNPDGLCRLSVSVSSMINNDQLWRLFDLVPGLDYCDRVRDRRAGSGASASRALFSVVFNNPQSATYAKEKLHGFEYPPGYRMVVKFDSSFDGPCHGHPLQHQHPMQNLGRDAAAASAYGRAPAHLRAPLHPPAAPASVAQLHPAQGGGVLPLPLQTPLAQPPQPPQPQARSPASLQSDLAQLTETIANATALLQSVGYVTPAPGATPQPTTATNGVHSETYDPSYCSVKLPAPQPLAAMDSAVAERLFIVCTPVPPQLYALKDVFGRFGNLIDIYLLNGKTCGYAKYASKESADRAIAALHGQEVCGCRLKVMPADPQQEKSVGDAAAAAAGRKRPKIAEADQ